MQRGGDQPTTSPPPQLAPQVKIADFGASTVVKVPRIDSETSRELPAFKKAGSLRDSIGTPCNMAPEVFNRSYGPMADMWSFGCVVYELLTGTPRTPTTPHALRCQAVYQLLVSVPANLPPSCPPTPTRS